MLKSIQMLYNSFLFYGGVLLFPISPGTLAWKLFRNTKGKIPLIKRDLICDTETLLAMPKNDVSLDEFTTAFSPFIPLLTLNALPWKIRRTILSDGLRKIDIEKDIQFKLPLKKGDVYWDIFENVFQIGFKLIFGRVSTSSEFVDMYPGIVDINKMIKRQSALPSTEERLRLYNRVLELIGENSNTFIFADSSEFKNLSELDQVSLVVEDLLTSICIQCTDLICHMLLLYSSYQDCFKDQLDNCINETLRLFPLTDIWTRKTIVNERPWMASLTQLNRNGWSDPDSFKPERWNANDHPQLISWGFDGRACPATKIGYNLSKKIFQEIINDNIWVQPASNFVHKRTFTSGCQVWTGEGKKPESLQWQYRGKWKKLFKVWCFSRLRMLDQKELW